MGALETAISNLGFEPSSESRLLVLDRKEIWGLQQAQGGRGTAEMIGLEGNSVEAVVDLGVGRSCRLVDAEDVDHVGQT